jgi:hypothetical protein
VSASAGWSAVLSIGKLGASAGQLEYYERQVAEGAEEYYAGRREVPGAWIGAGSAALGLTPGGRVSRDGFMALMRGEHPVDGWVLRRMTERSKVAAIDLTFSAPKSVSVLFAVAGGGISEALVEAHGRAVAAAVGYLEREACFTGAVMPGLTGSLAGGSSLPPTGTGSRRRAIRSCIRMSSSQT